MTRPVGQKSGPVRGLILVKETSSFYTETTLAAMSMPKIRKGQLDFSTVSAQN